MASNKLSDLCGNMCGNMWPVWKHYNIARAVVAKWTNKVLRGIAL